MPVTLQEKSSRNCHFVCSVSCGVSGFAPIATPLGNTSSGSGLLSGIAFLKLANWIDDFVQLRAPAAPSCDSG